MKTTLFTKSLLATAGTFLICTAPLAYAQDAASGRQAEQQQQSSQDYQSQQLSESSDFQSSQSQELKTDSNVSGVLDAEVINEPAGAERKSSSIRSSQSSLQQESTVAFGTLSKSSAVIGTDVRDERHQKLGKIKDVMIDSQSGRIPFVVLSIDDGDQLIALPPSAFAAGADEKTLTLSIDKTRLQSAPSFSRADWPDMSNPQFSTEVYHFYNAQPYWQSSGLNDSYQSEFETEITSEPAGAAAITTYESFGSNVSSDADYLDAEANRRLREYQRGKGAAEFTDRKFKERGTQLVPPPSVTFKPRYQHGAEHIMNAPGSKEVVSTGPSETIYTERKTTYQVPTYSARSIYSSAPTPFPAGSVKFYRASELMGMNIKDAQDETVGEIKDVVIDLHSGRIAYTVVSAGGFLGVGEKWVAVPSPLFTPSGDTLVLNVDKTTLKDAPTFSRSDWATASNQEFVSSVYSHYGQQPYWEASGQFREPAGTELRQESQSLDQSLEKEEFQDQQQLNQQDQQDEPQSGEQSEQQRSQSEQKQSSEANEPAGAESKSRELDDEESQSESLNDPAGAPSDVKEHDIKEYKENQDYKESPEQSSSEIKDPSGAETSQSSVYSNASEDKAAAVSDSSSLNTGEKESTQSSIDAQANEAAGAQSQSKSAGEAETEVTEKQISESAESSSIVDEPAGAATTGNNLADRVRSAIQSDTSISGNQNIQVSSENGKIVLRGNVNSSSEKMRIEEKIRQMVIDNQLEVRTSSDDPSQSGTTPATTTPADTDSTDVVPDTDSEPEQPE